MRIYICFFTFLFTFPTFIFGQFPYLNKSHLSEFKETPIFLKDLGYCYISFYENGRWNRRNVSNHWTLNYPIEEELSVDKIIMHEYSSDRRDTMPTFRRIVIFDDYNNPIKEEKWEKDTLLYRRTYFYTEDQLVDEVKVFRVLNNSITPSNIYKYEYDDEGRIISEKRLSKGKEGKYDFVVENQSMEYKGDSVNHKMFENGFCMSNKTYVYREGLLKETIKYRGAKGETIIAHSKFNQEGRRIYFKSRTTTYLNNHGKSTSKEKYENKESQANSNDEKKGYDENGYLIYEEVYEYGRKYRVEYKYDDKRRIIEKDYFKDKNKQLLRSRLEKFSYDENDRKIKTEYFNAENELDRYFIHNYSDDGKLLNQIIFSKEGTFQYEEGIRINKYGQVEEQFGYGYFPEIKRVMKYYNFKNVFDDDNRLIKQTTYSHLQRKGTSFGLKCAVWEVYYK